MLKIRKNSLDNIQLGKKKEDLPESIINNTLYFLEFDRSHKKLAESTLITISVREVHSFDINGKVISFRNIVSFLEDENPLVEDESFYIFPKYCLSLYINWDEKIFNEVLIYDISLKKEYEKDSLLTYEEIIENQQQKKRLNLNNLFFVPYVAVGSFKFGMDSQSFSQQNNFNIPKEISKRQVIEFDKNILIRFDENKLTQVVINNRNNSIFYNNLNLFSQDALDELIRSEEYIERNLGYVFVNLGLAITHDIDTIYFFHQSLLPFWKNKHRPITSW